MHPCRTFKTLDEQLKCNGHLCGTFCRNADEPRKEMVHRILLLQIELCLKERRTVNRILEMVEDDKLAQKIREEFSILKERKK